MRLMMARPQSSIGFQPVVSYPRNSQTPIRPYVSPRRPILNATVSHNMRDGTLDLAWNTRAARIQNRIDTLASITDESGMITRTFLSPAMQKANQLVAEWMREARLASAEDRVGNLVGQSAADPGAPVFLLGSHLDSVRNAGRFDGPLGVLLAIEAADVLRSNSVEMPFSLAVVGFSDE